VFNELFKPIMILLEFRRKFGNSDNPEYGYHWVEPTFNNRTKQKPINVFARRFDSPPFGFAPGGIFSKRGSSLFLGWN